MNNSSTTLDRLRHVLTTPTNGVLGLVDELLKVARDHGVGLDWKAEHCRVRFVTGSSPVSIEVPFRKSVFRAALARIAVLCNQRKPNSVAPYGGQGEFLIGTDSTTLIRATFVNTPDEQSLELVPLRDESRAAMPETVTDGQDQNATQVPSS